jgi:hypothetical protein
MWLLLHFSKTKLQIQKKTSRSITAAAWPSLYFKKYAQACKPRQFQGLLQPSDCPAASELADLDASSI